MKTKIYCIFDRIAQEAGPIFEAKNDGIALRMYHQVNLPGSSEDYYLLRVGDFDHETCVLTPLKTALEVLERTEVEDGDETVSAR